MYRSALLLVTYFCLLLGSTARGEEALTVLVEGDSVSPAVLGGMEREANRDLAPSGINLAWKFGRELDGRAVNGALVLIHLRGECRSGAPVPHPSSGSPTLGQTHIADGRILPIADVLCDAIRNLIDRDLRAALPGDSEVLLGRALGRVTAHELFHILLQTTTHSRDGLARAAQSASELLAPRSSFTRLDQRKIAQFSLATGDSP